MRHIVWTSALVCGIYGLLTSIWLARAGVVNGIAQLVAAGGAESLAGFLCIVAGFMVLWRVWVALAGFLLNLVWCSAIATAYGDQTVWLWCAANAIWVGLCIAIRIRRRESNTQTSTVIAQNDATITQQIDSIHPVTVEQ